jgi:thimet oligopeptidase
MTKISRPLFGIAVSLLAIASTNPQELAKDQPTIWSSKPDITAFEKMENDRITAAQASVDQLVAAQGKRTIENTLVPYDEATRQLNSALYFASFLQQVHPDAAFRDRATAMTTKVSGVQTALSLNRKVYQALSILPLSSEDAATRYYVQRQLLEFRLAGVDKDEAIRTRLLKLNQQVTDDVSMYDRNISDDGRTIDITNTSALDGLPQDFIDHHKPGADGKIHIPADEPNSIPMMTFAKDGELRRQTWEAFWTRSHPKNKQVLLDMMQKRYEIATLLGYSSWADYNAADKMIGNGRNVAKFLEELDRATQPVAEREFAMVLAEARKANPAAKEIPTYDYYFLPELVRRSQYDFDSQSVRPYLPYNQVKQGVLDTAATLFHVAFRKETNAPVWAPSVETWDVIDHGRMIGRFYLDMHPRPGKYSHAEMAPLLDGVRGKQLPEVALVCNFPEPTDADPGLMDHSEVVTFFHEFGHLMHHILGGQQQWAGIAGISMESDFTEAPSQMLEEWMRSPQVLTSFARHYKTGEPIPAELVARMNRASAFGRANWVALQTTFTAMSYDFYKDRPEKVDLEATTLADFRRYMLWAPVQEDAHQYASFGHLASYSSAYYTYLWDKVIAEDFFGQFDQANLLAGEAPMRYRRLVLEPGGSMSANELVKNFLGRPQNMAAFQRWLGEEFAAAPAGQTASE